MTYIRKLLYRCCCNDFTWIPLIYCSPLQPWASRASRSYLFVVFYILCMLYATYPCLIVTFFGFLSARASTHMTRERARARTHTHTHMRPPTQHLEVLEDADINYLGLKVVQGRLLQRMLAHVKVKVCRLGQYRYSSFYTQECRGRRG